MSTERCMDNVEAPPQPGCTACLEGETGMQQVADMIMRQCPTEEILAALCTQARTAPEDRECAFLLFDGTAWNRVAAANLTPPFRAALNALDPESLSAALLAWESGSGQQGFSFHSGWASHLYSGVG